MVRVLCVLDSSKFHSKLHYVHRLDELRHLIPLDHVYICDEVKRYTPRPKQPMVVYLLPSFLCSLF